MKKIFLVLICGASALISVQASANRARALVLGSGDGGIFLGTGGSSGSFLIDDNYNMFYNPSVINNGAEWAVIEKSNFPGTTAQGGFVMAFLNYRLGVFMNRTEAMPSLLSQRANMRPLDLILGADVGMIKAGVSLTWGSYALPGTPWSKDLTLRAGIQMAELEPFAVYKVLGNGNTTITSSSGSTSNEFANFSEIGAGMRYHLGEWTPTFAVKITRVSTENSKSGSFTPSNTFGLAMTRNTRAAEGLKLAYGIGYWRNTKPNGRSVVPLDFSIEADAATWFTLRAGVSYHALDQTAGASASDNTTGRMGAGFSFGSAKFDWAIGKAFTGTGPRSTESAADTDSQNFDFQNGFFSVASLGYQF